MDYLKTGRLIARKRRAQNYTLEELSRLLGVSLQAISLRENGQRFPDPSSQIMLFKVLALNPIKLLTGLEMFDDNLKADIAKHMNRIDENVFVAGMARDEDGNDFYLDLSEYDVVTVDKDGNLTDKWIPCADYYNTMQPPKPVIAKKDLEGS